MSDPRHDPDDTAGETLEPRHRGLGFLGWRANWPGILLMALGAILLLAASAADLATGLAARRRVRTLFRRKELCESASACIGLLDTKAMPGEGGETRRRRSNRPGNSQVQGPARPQHSGKRPKGPPKEKARTFGRNSQVQGTEGA